MKVCTGCGETKPHEQFYKNRKGVHSRCKPCYFERNKEYQKKYRKNNRFAIRMRSCRARAKEFNLPYDLDEDYLKSIWTGVCPAFGVEIDINAKKGEPHSAQLDRIVPSLGYVRGNVIWLSERANRIKDDATAEELEKLAQWLKSQ